MNPGRIRFGLYEFDAATHELRREGALVRLQQQPAQVLACLIERAGEVISREQLRQAVWGGETFVDFERGLNFCISQVRTALRDEASGPTYIRTIPKQGYQFIAPVERLPGFTVEGKNEASPANSRGRRRVGRALVACLLAGLALFVVYGLHFGRPAGKQPVVAILRFDNETADPAITSFSDALTDNVIEQMTSISGGRYRVIGNARILRLPREQRDLQAVASSLHAGYVILGQVRSNGTQVRILAHLIRVPDQTHIWVTRIDRDLTDAMSLESEAAHTIAVEFAPRAAIDPSRAVSLSSASH